MYMTSGGCEVEMARRGPYSNNMLKVHYQMPPPPHHHHHHFVSISRDKCSQGLPHFSRSSALELV